MESFKTNEKIEWAKQRSSVYGFLAAVYHRELKRDQIEQLWDTQFLAVLSEQGVLLECDFLSRPVENLIEELAVEYAGLFLGPGKHISPHESIHHQLSSGDWGRLWGDSTVEVKKFIESTGLTYERYSGLPDHISVELEFMHQVTRREAQAWEEGDTEGALTCMKMEQKFIEEHLYQWIPSFSDKVASEARHSFYREMAKLTKRFMEFEKEEIGMRISEYLN